MGDFAHIRIELMVAPRQPMDVSLRNRACVELDVRGRHDFVVETLIEVNGDVLRKPRAEVGREPEIVTRPASVAGERRRYQEEAGEVACQ